MTLTVGSLFSGIGGLELGLERAGMKTVWQVECDEYARKVLAKHWPEVERWVDVRIVHGRPVCPWRGCFECLRPVDLICGGFPCQDISVAGKGAGLAGERSGLWSEFRRLIGDLRPRYVLVENVSALLVRGLGTVLGDLATLGYDAEWDCIPAAAVGAPHRRDRLFVVAYAQREQRRLQPKPVAGSEDSTIVGDNGAQKSLADSLCSRLERQRQKPIIFGEEVARPCDTGWWASEPEVGRVAHGVSARVDRLRCLGNAVVPQVAEFIGRRIMEVAR